MRALLMAAAAFALVACGQTTTPAEETPPPAEPVAAAPTTREEATAQDTCGASGYASMVGSNIAAVTLPADNPLVRVVTPTSVVTDDFRPERVNIIAGADGVITSIECY